MGVKRGTIIFMWLVGTSQLVDCNHQANRRILMDKMKWVMLVLGCGMVLLIVLAL